MKGGMRRALLPVVLALTACGKSSQPAAPTPTPTPPPAPPPNIVLTGHLAATVTGEALSGQAINLATHTATTDSNGNFRYEFAPGTISLTPLISITGPNIVTRQAQVNFTTSRDLVVDAIALGGAFDLAFYRQLVRDDYSSPGLWRAINRWTSAPRLYLRTVDEGASPIDAATLDATEAALQDEAAAWTGGRFGLAEVVRGTETREGQVGWVTVKWPALPDAEICGRAQIAVNGGWIEFYYRTSGCAAPCSSSRIAPRIVRHELGHTMGFWHTGGEDDVMNREWHYPQCDQRPSAREKFHAAIAYSRPVGNADPDSDPFTTYLGLKPAVVVVD